MTALAHNIAFTGTQRGMTDMQRASVMRLIDLHSPGSFHHGCCIGADAEFHGMADQVGNIIIKHPPINERKIAKCATLNAKEIILPSLAYIERNHKMVDMSTVVIAAPFEMEEVLRSGTWATLRYAKKSIRPIFHVEPNGAVVKFNLPDDFEIWPRRK